MSYVTALNAVYLNGEVRYASYVVEPNPTLDGFLSRNQLHEAGFFERFWQQAAVKRLMPESLADLKSTTSEVFRHSSPFVLGGTLAWVLSDGGAYERHGAGPADAMRLGQSAATELVRDRFEQVLVYESFLPWSEFFHGVAWDYSWVVIDRIDRLVHVVCATDTD